MTTTTYLYGACAAWCPRFSKTRRVVVAVGLYRLSADRECFRPLVAPLMMRLAALAIPSAVLTGVPRRPLFKALRHGPLTPKFPSGLRHRRKPGLVKLNNKRKYRDRVVDNERQPRQHLAELGYRGHSCSTAVRRIDRADAMGRRVFAKCSCEIRRRGIPARGATPTVAGLAHARGQTGQLARDMPRWRMRKKNRLRTKRNGTLVVDGASHRAPLVTNSRRQRRRGSRHRRLRL